MIGGSHDYIFKRPWLVALADRPTWLFEGRVSELHVAIDPSGGGASSDWAIVTIAVAKRPYDTQEHVVVWYTSSSMNCCRSRSTTQPMCRW